jgi:hypothetical protein
MASVFMDEGDRNQFVPSMIGDLMRQKGRSGSGRADLHLELLAGQFDRTLASLMEVEIHLKNLGTNRLSQVAEALEIVADRIESLRARLQSLGQGSPLPDALRARMKRLENATGRVSALHQSARAFHAGLMLVRKRELAEYDALGALSDDPASLLTPYSLEARG